MKKIIRKHKYELVLGIFILIYVLYFTFVSFLRYDNFFTGRFDLGNMDQTVWNTIHGRIFQITDPNGTTNVSRLAFHADFILILISPLYLIWSNPKMLLLLQTVILGLGAIFVYFIAKTVIKNKNVALVFSAIYLLNPSLQYTNLYDFHAVVLGTTFLLATYYFFLKKKYSLFLLFAILSGLTKEDIWTIISIFGLAIIIRVIFENRSIVNFSKKQVLEILFGIATFLSSSFIFFVLIWIFIPQAKGSEHFALSYYSDFGGSASEISKNIFLMPLKTLSTLFSPQNLGYLFTIFLPFGFTSLIFPFSLFLVAPEFAINLLGTNPGFHQIYYQYTAAITPFLATSSIYAVAFLKNRFSMLNSRILIIYLFAATLISAYLYGPLPGAIRANISLFNNQLSNRKVIADFLAKIPTENSIAASNNLGSHLSRRQKIFTIPIGIDKADTILFLLNDTYAQPSLKAQKEMAKIMESNKKYILIFKDGDFVAFAKKKN